MTLHFYLRVVESKGAGDVIELQNRPVRFSNPATRLGNRASIEKFVSDETQKWGKVITTAI
jgi:hypothetical protein